MASESLGKLIWEDRRDEEYEYADSWVMVEEKDTRPDVVPKFSSKIRSDIQIPPLPPSPPHGTKVKEVVKEIEDRRATIVANDLINTNQKHENSEKSLIDMRTLGGGKNVGEKEALETTRSGVGEIAFDSDDQLDSLLRETHEVADDIKPMKAKENRTIGDELEILATAVHKTSRQMENIAKSCATETKDTVILNENLESFRYQAEKTTTVKQQQEVSSLEFLSRRVKEALADKEYLEQKLKYQGRDLDEASDKIKDLKIKLIRLTKDQKDKDKYIASIESELENANKKLEELVTAMEEKEAAESNTVTGRWQKLIERHKTTTSAVCTIS